MSDCVSYRQEDKVATITVDDGKVNAYSPELIASFNAAMDQIDTKQISALIITGRKGILTGGFDLKVMMKSQEARHDLASAGIKLFLRLLTFPVPIVVACNGHAVALGGILLMIADYRIGVQGDYKIGLNEVEIGVPMPQWAVELCRTRLSPNYYVRALMNAELYLPVVAVQAGFLDEVVKEEDLAQAVHGKAKQFSKLDSSAYKETKKLARKAEIEALERAVL